MGSDQSQAERGRRIATAVLAAVRRGRRRRAAMLLESARAMQDPELRVLLGALAWQLLEGLEVIDVPIASEVMLGPPRAVPRRPSGPVPDGRAPRRRRRPA